MQYSWLKKKEVRAYALSGIFHTFFSWADHRCARVLGFENL